jgi:hypothetical protein
MLSTKNAFSRIITLGMSRRAHMTIALVTALLLLRPMDCFGLAAMSQEAAECCLKGLCHHAGASDADCCKIDSHDSASLAQPSIKDSGCKVSVLVAVAVEPVKSISDHAWVTLPAGASRHPDSPPGSQLNLPLLI